MLAYHLCLPSNPVWPKMFRKVTGLFSNSGLCYRKKCFFSLLASCVVKRTGRKGWRRVNVRRVICCEEHNKMTRLGECIYR